MAESTPLLLRVFTHPACSGCSDTVDLAWRLTRSHPHVELRTVNLVNEHGLAEARAERIKTIPTVILSAGEDELERWVGAPSRTDLERSITGLAATA